MVGAVPVSTGFQNKIKLLADLGAVSRQKMNSDEACSHYRGEAEKARVEYTKALEMVQEQGQTLLLNLANQRLSQAGVRTFALGSRNATVK